MGRLTRDERIVAALLPWGGTELRDLPWRRTRDPWAVLVSEVMLQQTSVSRVQPKYEAFMQAFPSPAALAAAALGDALPLWQGLGYPRRCRNLREAASVVARDHAEAVGKNIPFPRIGTPEDMAGLAIFLAGRAGDYIVGETIACDGGIVNASLPGNGIAP